MHCYGDYLRDVMGSALENNQDEVEQIVQDVEAKCGKVIFHNDANMVTSVMRGHPAEIKVDKNCSIGGLRHEYRHFIDDLEHGCPGLGYYLRDKDLFFEFEKRGYEEELAIAREKGYTDIEARILNEIEKRRAEIYGEWRNK